MRPSRAWIYMGLGAALAGATAVGLVGLFSGPSLKPGDRVLLIGDSLAVGLTVPFGSLAREHGVTFKGLGTVGTRIDQWASSTELAQTLATFQPTIVIVSLGTNDAYMMGPPDPGQRQAPYLDKLLALLERSSPSPRALVWLQPPTLPPAAIALPSIRALIETLRRRTRIPVFVFQSQQLSLPRGPDGIHPVASGYAQWAGALWQWLT